MEIPEEQIKNLYRFADKLGEVNWNARYRPNYPFMERLIPSIYEFTDKNVRKVIYDKDNLRAVVGISGGLDSSLTAWITVETMRRARKNNSVNNTSLILIAFRGMSEEDLEYARRFAEELSSRYHELSIDYQERDLTGLLKDIDGYTENIVSSLKSPKIYSGELATRLIDCVVLEVADKTGHCSMDSTNGTEIVLGEIVLGAGAECAPIADFYKSQVYDIAELIGVPEFILGRPPINSTFGNDKVASYFGEIPDDFTPRDVYRVLDPVLFLVYDKIYKPRTVTRRLGHSLKFAEKVYQRVRNQGHRRLRPFFAINDRWGKLKRTAEEVDNEELERFMEESLEIRI